MAMFIINNHGLLTISDPYYFRYNFENKALKDSKHNPYLENDYACFN